jgi:hypothetical protein
MRSSHTVDGVRVAFDDDRWWPARGSSCRPPSPTAWAFGRSSRRASTSGERRRQGADDDLLGSRGRCQASTTPCPAGRRDGAGPGLHGEGRVDPGARSRLPPATPRSRTRSGPSSTAWRSSTCPPGRFAANAAWLGRLACGPGDGLRSRRWPTTSPAGPRGSDWVPRSSPPRPRAGDCSALRDGHASPRRSPRRREPARRGG